MEIFVEDVNLKTQLQIPCHPSVAREPTPPGAGGEGNVFSF